VSVRPGALALVAAVFGLAASAPGQAPDLAVGERVFRDNCAVCHGAAGDGQGMAANHFKTPPRDLTKGRFKFRSTASGQVPTEGDLARTIVQGVPSTGMVPQNHLSDADVQAVIAFVKSLSPRFAAMPSPKIVAIPTASPPSPEAVARGAKAYVKGTVKPQEFVNTFASGGAYSTADDMARIAMMFLNGGRVGTTRILSGASVAEMAKDQTIGSFDPIHSDFWAYGLGWDSVSQPGLAAVGFDGWAKGGDSNDYHAALVVSPRAQLGIVVLADSGPGSDRATAVAERVLLRALNENGRIATFPSPLLPVVPPVAPVPDGLLAAIAGEYATDSVIVQLRAQPDGSLLVSSRSDAGWTPIGSPLKYRHDGWFASDQEPLKAIKVVDADLLGVPTQYILSRAPNGYGHYLDFGVFCQRVRRRPGNLSAAWRARLSSTWLVVNENPDELAWNGMDPRLRLATVPNLEGLIAVRPPADPALAAGHIDSQLRLHGQHERVRTDGRGDCG